MAKFEIDENFIKNLSLAVKQNTIGIKAITDTFGSVRNEIAESKLEIIHMRDDMNNLKIDTQNRMNRIEANMTADSRQAERIFDAVHARVNYILDNPADRAKYYSGFVSCLWSDAKKYANVARRYRDTKVCFIESAIGYIGNWVPEVSYNGKLGILALKDRIDDSAAANLEAKINGYGRKR